MAFSSEQHTSVSKHRRVFRYCRWLFRSNNNRWKLRSKRSPVVVRSEHRHRNTLVCGVSKHVVNALLYCSPTPMEPIPIELQVQCVQCVRLNTTNIDTLRVVHTAMKICDGVMGEVLTAVQLSNFEIGFWWGWKPPSHYANFYVHSWEGCHTPSQHDNDLWLGFGRGALRVSVGVGDIE